MSSVTSKKFGENHHAHPLLLCLAAMVLGAEAAKGSEGLGSCLSGHVDPVLLPVYHLSTACIQGAGMKGGVTGSTGCFLCLRLGLWPAATIRTALCGAPSPLAGGLTYLPHCCVEFDAPT